jgi:hypothetical protein
MSEAEKRFILGLIVLGLVCVTVLYGFLFIALWAYKEAVGISLLVALGLVVWVFMRGKLNEQDLRRMRYNHHQETPLDERGEPVYWHAGMQQNPNRIPMAYYQPQGDLGQRQ